MKIDEAFFRFSADFVGDPEVGNLPALLHLWIRYAVEAAVLPDEVAISNCLTVEFILTAGRGKDDAVALAAGQVAAEARETADHTSHPAYLTSW